MDPVSPLSVKAEIKIATEIPASSTGRLVDSLTDIIRPLSESLGWMGDLVAERRKRALEVVERANARLNREDRPYGPIPAKVLIPLLEKASLEDAESPLMDRWADLLASAAMQPETVHPRYPQILSEITPREARILRWVARNGYKKSDNPQYDLYYKANRAQSSKFEAEYREYITGLPNDRYVALHNYLQYFEVPGVYPIDVWRRWHTDKDDDPYLELRDYVAELVMDIENEQSIDVLASLGLLYRGRLLVETPLIKVDARYICLTYLGADFITNCDATLWEA